MRSPARRLSAILVRQRHAFFRRNELRRSTRIGSTRRSPRPAVLHAPFVRAWLCYSMPILSAARPGSGFQLQVGSRSRFVLLVLSVGLRPPSFAAPPRPVRMFLVPLTACWHAAGPVELVPLALRASGKPRAASSIQFCFQCIGCPAPRGAAAALSPRTRQPPSFVHRLSCCWAPIPSVVHCTGCCWDLPTATRNHHLIATC